MVKPRCFFHVNIIQDCFQPEALSVTSVHVNKVNNTQLRKFLGLYSLLMLRIWLNHDALFMSILFRIVSSLNHFQLPLFMLSKVNETMLRQYLGFYCLSKLRILLNHDAFFMSILFRIVSSLKNFQLPLFMLIK